MADIVALRAALQRIGFTAEAATAITDEQQLNSLEEIRILKFSEVETLVKTLRRPGGATGTPPVPNPGLNVALRAETNLKRTVFFLNHKWRTSRDVNAADITLDAIRALDTLRDQEANYEAPTDYPTLNDQDWPTTMDAIKAALRARQGEMGIPLSYVIRDDVVPPDDHRDPSTNYETISDEIVARAPHGSYAAGAFDLNPVYQVNNEKVWLFIERITHDHYSWTHVKAFQSRRDGRGAYRALYDAYLGSNAVDALANKSERRLASLTYNGESKRWNFDRFIRAHKNEHNMLRSLMPYGYSGIDARSEVRYLNDGIKTDKLNSVKTTILADPALRSDFKRCVDLYTDFIANLGDEAKAPSTRQIAAVGKAEKTGTAAGSDSTLAVEDRFYSDAEYQKLTAAQKAALHRMREARGHKKGAKSSKVLPKDKPKGTAARGGSNASTQKALAKIQRSVKAIDKRTREAAEDSSSSSDSDSSSEPETTKSPQKKKSKGNRGNAALTRQGTAKRN